MRAAILTVMATMWFSTGPGMAAGTYCPPGDMNGDCSVDIGDLTILRHNGWTVPLREPPSTARM
jgi:hypothetical protein